MKKLIVFTLSLLLLFCLDGCGSVYEKQDTSYRRVTNVKGLEFDVYSNMEASAIVKTGIGEEEALNDGNTFLFKNSDTEYIVYNSKQYVVVAGAAADLFDETFSDSDKKDYITDAYFSKSSVVTRKGYIKYKEETKKNVYKLLTDKIELGVAPNVNSFQNYYGYLTYLTDGTNAYYVFAGTTLPVEQLDDDTRTTLLHIVKSAELKPIKNEEPLQEDVPISNENVVSIPVDNPPATEQENPANTEEKIPEEETIQEEHIEEVKAPVEEEVIVPNHKELSNLYSTAKFKDGVQNNPVTAGIYSYLSVEEYANVTILSINADAEDVVKTLTSGDYMAPKDGCHIELIKFKSEATIDGDYYIDFKLCGKDGNKLTYNGIKYTMRTYDILYKNESYCYYEVPNGCKNYSLLVGNSVLAGKIEINN